MPKATRKPTQPMDGNLTLRQSTAARLREKFSGEVSWKFGHASFETGDGKVFCFINRDGNLALKLPESRIAVLLEDGHATSLTMGKRTMREWVVVPEPDSEASVRLLHEARAYVESLPVASKRKSASKPAAKKKTR